MAVTLSIELTDAQQAIMVALSPDGTNAEKKAWAESVARAALRREIADRQRIKLQADAIAARDAAQAQLDADHAAAQVALETDWPE
jgi:hypothetical protein